MGNVATRTANAYDTFHTHFGLVTTEFATLDSLYALNSRISASIDMGLFSYLEDVWHIDSGASNHITRDRNDFSDYHLSSSKLKIWTGGRPVAVEGYGSAAMDWITRQGDRVPVIPTRSWNNHQSFFCSKTKPQRDLWALA